MYRIAPVREPKIVKKQEDTDHMGFAYVMSRLFGIVDGLVPRGDRSSQIKL